MIKISKCNAQGLIFRAINTVICIREKDLTLNEQRLAKDLLRMGLIKYKVDPEGYAEYRPTGQIYEVE